MTELDEFVEAIPDEDSGEDEEPGRLPAHPRREMIRRFLDQQAEEIAVRSQEVQVRQLEVKAAYKYSRATLDAQERDLRDQRSEERKKRRDQLCFVGFATLLLMGLMVYLLQSGQDGLAQEILKGLVYITMAATSGFFAGRSAERKKREAESSE